MGVRVGNNYIVSFSVNPQMHDKINKLPKGRRSHFLRRAVFNALEYDAYRVRHEAMVRDWGFMLEGLMQMIRYQQSRILGILAGEDPHGNGDFSKYMRFDLNDQTWIDAFAAIEELTHHIGGLNSAQRAYVDMVDGKRWLMNEKNQD